MNETAQIIQLAKELAADLEGSRQLLKTPPPKYPKKKESRSHLVRKRALRRGCSLEPFKKADVPFAWAAYARGKLAGFPEGLKAAQFGAELMQKAMQLLDAGGDIYTLRAKTPMGEIPVGFATVSVAKPPNVAMQIIPEITWLPEASPRNKVECALKLLVALKAEGNVFIAAQEVDWKFLNHLAKYGVLRPIGKSRNYFDEKTDALWFEGVR